MDKNFRLILVGFLLNLYKSVFSRKLVGENEWAKQSPAVIEGREGQQEEESQRLKELAKMEDAGFERGLGEQSLKAQELKG